ncbi:MAG: TIGR02444 family protein [Rhizobiaceae bacterium]
MIDDLGTHPFWEFSLRLYGLPGIAPACLHMQDRLGIDVNLVLFFVWWGATGRNDLEAQDFETIVARATRWQEDVVRPVRNARRAAKAGAPQLSDDEARRVYREVLSTELLLERAEQLIIARTADRLDRTSGCASPGQTIRNLLGRYFFRVGVAARPEDWHAATTVIDGALALPAYGEPSLSKKRCASVS